MDDSNEKLVQLILQYNEHFDVLEQTKKIMNKSKLNSEKFRIKGNSLYNQNKHSQTEHKELISFYTASIAFAPKDSEELPKGYGNRAAALMHLHLYEEALIDIDRALLILKSDDLKAKLVLRKERCLKLKCKSNCGKISDDLPKMQPSKRIPNASEAVDIAYSEKFGRHLVATRDIKPGEVIVVEQSYAYFPKQNKIHIVCSHCMKFTWNGIPCDTCAFAIFCSEECKDEAWQEYHHIECSIIPSMFYTEEESITNMMVMIRLFIKAVKRESFTCLMNEIKISEEEKDKVKKLLYNKVLDSKKFRSYYNLQLHTQDDEDNQLIDDFDYNSTLLIVSLFLRHTTIIPVVNKLEELNSTDKKLLISLTKVFLRLKNILCSNTFMHQASLCYCKDLNDCQNSNDSGSGTLLAATCSLINHSCCSNVSRIFLPKGKIVMFTTASVKKGQQLFVSYGPAFHSLKKEERQKYLRENYYFFCYCQACKEDWPQDIEFEILRNPISMQPGFDKFTSDFIKYFPTEESFSINEIIDQQYYEKSTLEKVLVFCHLYFKYFDYRTAYYNCLQFRLCINRSFLKLYGEKCVMPKNC